MRILCGPPFVGTSGQSRGIALDLCRSPGRLRGASPLSFASSRVEPRGGQPFSEVPRRGHHEAGFGLVNGALPIDIESGPPQKLDEGECFFLCEVCRYSNALSRSLAGMGIYHCRGSYHLRQPFLAEIGEKVYNQTTPVGAMCTSRNINKSGFSGAFSKTHAFLRRGLTAVSFAGGFFVEGGSSAPRRWWASTSASCCRIAAARDSRSTRRKVWSTGVSDLPKFSLRISRAARMRAVRSSAWERSRSVMMGHFHLS